ncbi:hypothetical protein OG788_39360 [Streptomyces sp. NBC_00647]|uniref:hypothetical protein n=1 Tax=Streptomyces sp. NBC_00647 TaxID=2975796 RepID=UPI0032515D33
MGQQRAWVHELLTFAQGPVWEVTPEDVDGWPAAARARGAGTHTRAQMAHTIHRFYSFLQTRHARDAEEAAGRPLVQPVDEFNQPHLLARAHVRIPPSAEEVEALFAAWRSGLPGERGSRFLTGARDYVAASLWRRVGLRNETVRLQAGDWYPQVGAFGVLHIRWGKGAKGSDDWCRPSTEWTGCWRGGCPRCAASSATTSRCHQGDGSRRPACAETLRHGLAQAVAHRLPAWKGPSPRTPCGTSAYFTGMRPGN